MLSRGNELIIEYVMVFELLYVLITSQAFWIEIVSIICCVLGVDVVAKAWNEMEKIKRITNRMDAGLCL